MDYFPLYESLPINISIKYISNFLTYREFINISILSKYYYNISEGKMKIIKRNNTSLVKYYNPFWYLYPIEIRAINYNFVRFINGFNLNDLSFQ
jgi:hypothetical protein